MTIEKAFPFLKWKPLINRHQLYKDLIAGLVGAIVVLPQGIAFATIAGLPPEYGLYSAMIPAIIAAIWGSSRHLVSGPTTAISLVVYSVLINFSQPSTPEYIKLVLTLSFLVGAIQLILGFLKLGTLLNFISHTVVIGFTAGAGILILSNQIKNFFGISMPSGVPFYEIIHLFITKIDHINPYVAGVAGVTLFLGILIKKFYPTIPYMIPTMLLGSLLGYYLNDHYTFAVTGIKTIGALPAALPPMSLPDFSLATIRKLASPALAISFLALTEAVAIAKAIALRSGQNIDGNQEFVGQGLSNVIGSLFSAYPSSGSFNRSGLNYESGAQTPLASIFAAVFLGTIILFASGLVAYFPLAVMAAILFLVAWGLIDFHHIKEIIKTSRSETALLAITFLATLFLELEFAVLLGVFISIALYLRRTSKPVIEYCVPDSSNLRHRFVKAEKFPSCPQLAVVRLTGSLFFGAMSCFDASFKEIKEKHPTQKYLLIIGRGINFLDLSGANLLIQYIRSYREEGGDLFVCNLNEEITARFKKLGVTEFLGEDHLYCSKAEAVASIYLQLDPKVCAACATHVFYECQKQ